MLAWFRGTMGRLDQNFLSELEAFGSEVPALGCTIIPEYGHIHMYNFISDCDLCLVSGSFGWAETNTQGRIFWQSGTEQLFVPFASTALSSKGDQCLSLFPPCAGYSQQSKSCSFSLSLHLQWLSIWPCWYAGLQDGFAPFPLGPLDSFPICSTGVWKATKCRKILHSLQSGCLGMAKSCSPCSQRGDGHFQRMLCSTPGRGFKADGVMMWQVTTFSCPLLQDQLRADSSLSRPDVQRAGSWTRIHLVLRRHTSFECNHTVTMTLELRLGDHSHALGCLQGVAKPAHQGHQPFGHSALVNMWVVLAWLPELLSPFLSNHLALKAAFYSSVILLSELKSISRAVSVSLLWLILPFHICNGKQTQFSKHLCYPLTAFPCKSVLVPEPGRKGKVSLMNPTSPSHAHTIRYCLLPPISSGLWR